MPEALLYGVVFVVIPLALILHYITRWREGKGFSTDEEKMLEDLWESTQKMESRINVLESILDDEIPDWRRKV